MRKIFLLRNYCCVYVSAAPRLWNMCVNIAFLVTNFIQQPLPAGSNTGAGGSDQSGALNMGQQASTGLTTFNTFWVYLVPLVCLA